MSANLAIKYHNPQNFNGINVSGDYVKTPKIYEATMKRWFGFTFKDLLGTHCLPTTD